MKLKKCQWINKPEKVRFLTSRSLTFLSENEHHFVHTTDTDEKIIFSFQSRCECGIAVIFSIDQGLRIYPCKDKIVEEINFLDIRKRSSWQTQGTVTSLCVEKRDDEIIFSHDGVVLTSFAFRSIAASVSISFYAKGRGQTTFTFS